MKKPTGSKKVRALLILLVSLLLFGLLLVYDSTAIYSQTIYHDPYRFVTLQLLWVFLGVLAFLFFYYVKYTRLIRLAFPVFVAALFLLVLLAVAGMVPCDKSLPFAPCVNGATRWLYLNPAPLPKIPILGVIGFQPSEFAKLALILYLAVLLAKNDTAKATKQVFSDGFITYIVVAALFSFLVVLQPNMSTALILFGIATFMYFSSKCSLKPLMLALPALVILAILIALISPYRRERLLTFISGKSEEKSGYHINQIAISLGSGGLFGVGLGQSKQKYNYLPEVASDSIFAIVGEELGFVGATALIAAFCYFVFLGIAISRNAQDAVGRLLGVGITAWIGMQTLVNVAAMSGIIPLTGVPVPLISYGGTSMIFTMSGLGILANIGKPTKNV